MHSRVLLHVFSFAIAISLVIGAVPPPTAAAHDGGDLIEIRFPQNPYVTDFSSTFGHARSGGRRHKGNDLLAPRMTEVYAAADGVVIHVGTNRLSGRNLRIQHPGKWTSHYVHLNNDTPGTDDGKADWSYTVAPGIAEGTFVEAGQLIGWVGDSGNAEHTTPHTHFELRHAGRAINPYPLLVEAYERELEIRFEALTEAYPID